MSMIKSGKGRECTVRLEKYTVEFNFIYPFKEPAFGFVDFCYCLLCFFCIYFCPDFYDFFPSTNSGVLNFFFFLVALGVELGYLFDFFLVS